jgi:hypothetical protein
MQPPQPTIPIEMQTNVAEVTTDGTGDGKEEENVGGWDESGQVTTDVEDDPQHTSWADSSSYETYYGGEKTYTQTRFE